VKALVTGFEPFAGEDVNASLEAVRRLPPRIGALGIVTAELPTSYARSHATLEAVIARAHPEIVLCVGQARSRAALCVERIAVNMQDADIADNDGVCPVDAPVIAGGPVAYAATLPVRAAVAALHAAKLPAELSMSAGTFVCNHVFYGLMHIAATRGHAFRGGFLHVPRMPQQAMRDGDAPPMAIEDIVRGLGVVLETAAAASRS
jgi:pyroglutamyl-peptidase